VNLRDSHLTETAAAVSELRRTGLKDVYLSNRLFIDIRWHNGKVPNGTNEKGVGVRIKRLWFSERAFPAFPNGLSRVLKGPVRHPQRGPLTSSNEPFGNRSGMTADYQTIMSVCQNTAMQRKILPDGHCRICFCESLSLRDWHSMSFRRAHVGSSATMDSGVVGATAALVEAAFPASSGNTKKKIPQPVCIVTGWGIVISMC